MAEVKRVKPGVIGFHRTHYLERELIDKVEEILPSASATAIGEFIEMDVGVVGEDIGQEMRYTVADVQKVMEAISLCEVDEKGAIVYRKTRDED